MQVRDKRLHGTPYRRYDVFVHPHPTLGVRMDEWEHAFTRGHRSWVPLLARSRHDLWSEELQKN